jgi:hypothetical protein
MWERGMVSSRAYELRDGAEFLFLLVAPPTTVARCGGAEMKVLPISKRRCDIALNGCHRLQFHNSVTLLSVLALPHRLQNSGAHPPLALPT